MSTFSMSEFEAAIENWLTSNPAVRKGWKRENEFWLISETRDVRFDLCSDGTVEIELLERPARKVAPVTSVRQAVQLVDLFLRQGCGFDTLPGGDWKSFWRDRAVPATIIDHPERITVKEIDSQPDWSVRDAMIDCFGDDRYWQETKQHQTGYLHGLRHIVHLIECWRASTGVGIDIFRKTLCEGDPRNQEDVLVIRAGSRDVLFGEPGWRDSRAFVSVSEGGVSKVGYVSRREEVECLLDRFLRLRCRLEELPGLSAPQWEG